MLREWPDFKGTVVVNTTASVYHRNGCSQISMCRIGGNAYCKVKNEFEMLLNMEQLVCATYFE